MVVWQNEQLCQSKHAHHGPTSDGYDACKNLWSVNQDSEMTLFELDWLPKVLAQKGGF